MKASVCICTYNGVGRIDSVLAALARQTLSMNDWQVLVIDNASTDGTNVIATRLIRDLLGGRGRVVCQPLPGLSHARALAAREAEGEIICFLDDDNIPAPDFVFATIQAFLQYPRAGVIGGKILPRWETQPTPLAEAVANFALAICDEGESPKQNNLEGGGIVGAGLCVRRNLLLDIFASSALAKVVTDRTGSNLISGGDLAISVVARKMGWECWYMPTLRIEHVLPVQRMKKDYLLRLYEGIGRGQAATRRISDWKARSPLVWLIGIKDLCRWLLGQWRKTSVAACHKHPEIAKDLHDLQQRLVWGRAMQAISFPKLKNEK